MDYFQRVGNLPHHLESYIRDIMISDNIYMRFKQKLTYFIKTSIGYICDPCEEGLSFRQQRFYIFYSPLDLNSAQYDSWKGLSTGTEKWEEFPDNIYLYISSRDFEEFLTENDIQLLKNRILKKYVEIVFKNFEKLSDYTENLNKWDDQLCDIICEEFKYKLLYRLTYI